MKTRQVSPPVPAASPEAPPEMDEWGQKIVSYYDDSWLDFKWFWLNRKNLSMHFGHYDERSRTHAKAMENTVRVMANHVLVSPGDHVFDAGCGVGGPALWLAQERGATVCGVTLSADQARRANRYARKRRLDRQCQFSAQDFRFTTFPSESFDVVWACETIGHTRDQREFYKEAFRLLKPGGRLLIRDGYLRRRPEGAEEERLTQLWFDGWILHDLPELTQGIRWLEETGFEEVEATDVTVNTTPSGRRVFRFAWTLRPLSRLLTKLRIRTPVQHANVVGSIAAWRCHQRGMVVAAMVLARKPA